MMIVPQTERGLGHDHAERVVQQLELAQQHLQGQDHDGERKHQADGEHGGERFPAAKAKRAKTWAAAIAATLTTTTVLTIALNVLFHSGRQNRGEVRVPV